MLQLCNNVYNMPHTAGASALKMRDIAQTCSKKGSKGVHIIVGKNYGKRPLGRQGR
jgi:hypothetical protein